MHAPTTLFKRATRAKSRLRLAIDGPSGSGKTYTTLRLAHALAADRQSRGWGNGRVLVIDSENGSASKYAGDSPDGIPWDFDVCELFDFSPTKYTEIMTAAARAGYSVIVVDSLSHAWSGSGGALELVDKAKGKNKFTDGWRDVTPMHNAMIETMIRLPADLIVTMRTHTAYEIEYDDRGKAVPKKVGTKPVQRAGMEYEFDIVLDMDVDHIAKVSKTRCTAIDGKQSVKPGPEFFAPILYWLNEGADIPKELIDGANFTPIQAVDAATGKPKQKTAQELLQEAAARMGVGGSGSASGSPAPTQMPGTSASGSAGAQAQAFPPLADTGTASATANDPSFTSRANDDVHRARANAPASQEQLVRIREALSHAEQLGATDIKAKLIANLEAKGKRGPNDLMRDEAEALITAISGKITDLRFAQDNGYPASLNTVSGDGTNDGCSDAKQEEHAMDGP